MNRESDARVLKAICEYSVRINFDWLDTDGVLQIANSYGIAEDDFFDSIEILNNRGYIKTHGRVDRPGNIEVKPYGFVNYANQYVPDYEHETFRLQTLQAIIDHGGEVTSEELAIDLNKPNVFVAHILKSLDEKGDIRVKRKTPPRFVIIVNEVTAQGRRAARSE